MSAPVLEITHGVIFLLDPEDRGPSARWTARRHAQGFTRSRTSASLTTIEPEGTGRVFAAPMAAIAGCTRVTSLSVYSDSGRVALGDIHPDKPIIWTGRPGWVRVTIGQRLAAVQTDDEWPDIEILYLVEATDRESPTKRTETGIELDGPFEEA